MANKDDLTDSEIDLINMLRGFTAEGEDLAAPWSLRVAYVDGRWTVCTDGVEDGEPYMMESGAEDSFETAWIMQCDSRLRADVAEHHAKEQAEKALRAAPRLRLIKGGMKD